MYSQSLTNVRPCFIQGASLAINDLDDVFLRNQNQLDLMENFIKSKTSEIANLQEYLLAQFQHIQNGKVRNKKIQKILVTQTLPMLRQISNQIQQFRRMLAPFATIAFSYVSSLSSKAQQLLSQQRLVIQQQAQIIKQLQEQIKFHKLSQTQNLNSSQPKDVQLPPLQFSSPKSSYHTEIINKLTLHHQKSSKVTPKKQLNYNVCKSPAKPNKYQQYYQNILENKKQMLNYRCQRPFSPLQALNPTLTNCKVQAKCQRKEYIKQKIEKIKIRTQCKDRKAQFSIYDKNM